MTYLRGVVRRETDDFPNRGSRVGGGGRSLEIFNSKKQQFRINSLYAIKSLEIKVYFFQSLMILS